MSRPGANKFLQGWLDEGGIQRAGRCENPKAGRGRQLVKGNPHDVLNEGWLGLVGQGTGGDFGQIHDLDLVLPGLGGCVLEHGHAKRAGGGYNISLCI